MIKILSYFKSWLLLLFLMVGSSAAWAADETIDFSDQGFGNGDAVTEVNSTNVTVTFAQGTNNNNAPKYYTTGTAVRVYGGNYFTVSSSKMIEKIEFTFASGEGTNTISSDKGTFKTNTWTGSENSIIFTISGSTGHRRIKKLDITFASSDAVNTSVTIDDAGITNNDVYKGTAAGSLSATVMAGNNQLSGATVTWTSSKENVATIDNDGVVTLVSAGTTIITASYAGVPNEYKSSSDTYTLTVIDTTPFTGGDVTFTCGTDTSDELSITKDGVTMTFSNGVWNRSDNYRLYANQTLTISTATGKIKKIVFTISQNNFSGNGYDSSTKTWEGNAETVTLSADGGQVRFTPVVVTVDLGDTSQPIISADNVNIDYNVTNGEIVYNLTNPVTGGQMTATSSENWLTIGTVGTTVPFTTTANNAATARTATVTLTYTYDSKTVTKNVTVTQAGDPDAVMTIAEVRAQATGSVVTKGVVTSCAGTTAYIQDATAAICVYGSSLTVGDEVRVSGTLSTYKGLLEITNPTVTVISSGNAVTPEVMTIAQVNASTNQGWLVKIENATVTAIDGQNTTIAQSENTIVVRGISGVNYSVGDVLTLTGNIGCFDVAQIANPTDITVAASTTPVIDADDVEIAYDATSGEIAYTINNPTTGVALSATTTATWISNITVASDKVTFNTTVNNDDADRTATFTLTYTGAADKEVTVTQKHQTVDYATLPFDWAGGSSEDFKALNGVTTYSLGSDYAASNAPYLIKFDGDGDYIQVKTDSQPGIVTIGVKMLGGANTSSITVQGSTDGSTFDQGEELTISGATNTELTLTSTRTFDTDVRYVRLLFTKGSNVGVGAISIAKPSTDPVINANDVELEYDATSGEIAYTITNPAATEALSAATTATWISNITVASDKVTFTTTTNDGDADRTATITLSYAGANDKVVTVTQKHHIIDYATLPFCWVGSDTAAKEEFEAQNGVTANGLGTNYAASNAPYRLKLDGTGDYIQIKTDSQPLCVTLDVKMLGGADESKITVQGSSDGVTFTDVEELTISGAQNDVLYFETTNAFDANDRYVRLTFTKGSNVGVGAITINCVRKSISEAGYATLCSACNLDFSTVSGLTAYEATISGSTVTFADRDEFAAGEGILLEGAEGTYTIPVIATATANSDNKLKGVLVDTQVPAGSFVLLKDKNNNNKVGFYKTTQAFTVGAHTAYIEALSGGARDFIGFGDDTTTGITNNNRETITNNRYFNLNGQRVDAPAKGLYIVNGKKVVIK